MFYKFIYPNLPKPKLLTFLLKASQQLQPSSPQSQSTSTATPNRMELTAYRTTISIGKSKGKILNLNEPSVLCFNIR